MAKNREPVKPVESESESGEEDDEGSSEEVDSQESESESEETQTAMQKNSATPASPPPPQPPSPSSSEEEESGSETESESDGPDSRPNAPKPATPTISVAAKRLAEDTETPSKDAKKTKFDDSEASEKKPGFQRVWSEEDEIVLLKGILDYKNEMKSDPIANLNAFHDFVKKKLDIDFTRGQVQDKIWRLKMKFENNNGKEKEGKEKNFSKPHEQKSYDLSKMIWGNEIVKENGVEKDVGSPKTNGSVVRKMPKKKLYLSSEEEDEDVKNTEVVGDGGGGGGKLNLDSGGSSIEKTMLMTGRELFETGLGIEGENEWQKAKVLDLELHLKQLEVRVAQTKLVLCGMKAKDD